MEDWEQFFVEKSRRRAEVERRDQRRRNALRLGTGIVLGVTIVGGLIALALVQRDF